MCNNCSSDVESTQDIDLKELLSSSLPTDQQNTLLFFAEPISISTESLAEKVGFDFDEFNRGLKEGSYYSGIYTALANAGIDLETASAFISNLLTIEMQKIQAKATVEASNNSYRQL